jgi:sugar lactone lactonase YvrE
MTPDLVLDAKATVGESPVWDGATSKLWWTDIPARRLHCFDPTAGHSDSFDTPGRVGCFALARSGGLIVAMEHGLYRLEPVSGMHELFFEPEADRPENRFNDGRCDRRGRFLASSMHEPRTSPQGALWQLDPTKGVRLLADQALVGNGLAFSPDDRFMYWSDSRRHRVFRFEYDIETGSVWNQRLWLQSDDSQGRPDGAAIDTDGCYWSARFRGFRVIRFTPDGRIDREFRLPVSQVTMCAFGGSDLRTLFITTARENLNEAELAREPLAGGIFAVDPGCQGLPEPRYNG